MRNVRGQKAEGLEAQLAYEKALKGGYVKVYRGRILLIGQDRAGKTSLKKNLLGLPFDRNEQSTVGIEVDPSKCEIDVDRVKNWRSSSENKPGLIFSRDVAKVMTENMCNKEEDAGKDFEKRPFQNYSFTGGKVVLGGEDENAFLSEQVCQL